MFGALFSACWLFGIFMAETLHNCIVLFRPNSTHTQREKCSMAPEKKRQTQPRQQCQNFVHLNHMPENVGLVNNVYICAIGYCVNAKRMDRKINSISL